MSRNLERKPVHSWYEGRWITPVQTEDFYDAVQKLHEDMEHIARRKYNIKTTFYRAADPAALRFPDAPVPNVAYKTADGILGVLRITRADWKYAHRIESVITPATTYPGDKPYYTLGQVTAGWPDYRTITITVEPKENNGLISSRMLNRGIYHGRCRRGVNPG